jgi:endoglycosylceramidase
MPNVIGYEIMNEPWPGNHFQDPTLLIPGTAASSTLMTFHEKVARTIRSVDPTALIFFEGITWETHARYPVVPGGMPNQSVSSYHYYRPPSQEPPYEAFKKRAEEDTKRLGTGLMLTEFAMWENGQNGDGGDHRLEVLQAADYWLQSWVGWSYKTFKPLEDGESAEDGSIFDGKGQKRRHVEVLLSRPYASAVGGRVLKMVYDDVSTVFRYSTLSAMLDTLLKPNIFSIAGLPI